MFKMITAKIKENRTRNLERHFVTEDLYKEMLFESRTFTGRQVLILQELLDKNIINREVIYNYGLYLSLIGGEILGIDASLIYDLSNSLPIYQRKDLNISYNEICEVLNLSPSKKIKIIECELIKEVINGHIKNTSNDLKKYILANKSRWV